MRPVTVIVSGVGFLWCVFIIGWYLFAPTVPGPHNTTQAIGAEGLNGTTLAVLVIVLAFQVSIVGTTVMVTRQVPVAEILVMGLTICFALLCFVGITFGGLLLMPTVGCDLVATGLALAAPKSS